MKTKRPKKKSPAATPKAEQPRTTPTPEARPARGGRRTATRPKQDRAGPARAPAKERVAEPRGARRPSTKRTTRGAGDGEIVTTPAAPTVTKTRGPADGELAPPRITGDGELDGEHLVVAQIRELEAQLDRLIDEASRRDLSDLDPEDGPEDAPLTPEEAPIEVADPEGLAVTREIPIAERPELARSSLPERPSSASLSAGEATVFDTARDLLSSDFYLRKWGRLAMRGRSEEVDDFGFDPIYDQKARGALEFLYSRYFRVTTTGIDHVPARGRCLLVANHSGTRPLDGVMLKMAVKLEHPAPRDVRWLTEDFIYHMPYLGSIMNRLGAVRACQENAERLLDQERLCAVFPEGVKGIGKLFGERYRLQRFGRGGFIKLCLRTGTPIVPVAVVGAEETNPLLFKVEYLSKALGLPYVPVTPTFPALGPLGLLPAPTKWQIHFGEPIEFGAYDREAAEDELLVGKLAERVRATIQGMLDRAVGARKSVFFG